MNVYRLKKAIFEGTSKEAAERTGLSHRTIESYRLKETSKGYRDWQGISIKDGEAILKVFDAYQLSTGELSQSRTAELPFGRFTAKVEVSRQLSEPNINGKEVGYVTPVVLIDIYDADGKRLSHSNGFVKYYDYKKESDRFLFEKHNFDKNIIFSCIGQVIAPGEEHGQKIQEVIEKMHVELGMESQRVKREKEAQADLELKIKRARRIVRETEDPSKLMTDAEVLVWRKEYNDLYNEGGDGYIPPKISQEDYAEAVDFLKSVDK